MASTSAPWPRIVGRYALYGKIASGGMATVFFGRLLGPVGFSRTVAIKKLHPHFSEDPDFVSMFLDEARLAARIRHPNVVPTLDIVATEGDLFLVMEYVQGETLARLLRAMSAAGGRVPVPVVTAALSGVLHGLHAAHEAKNERGEPLGIVHRDVSPQNVIIGVDGVARVLDFGVAKAAGRLQTTREGQLKGKVAYMAPEQLRGAKATRQTDIYATSVVLWEALTGRRLFQDETEAGILQQILDAKVAPPSAWVPELPRALDEVVLRGLHPDPAARYPTARAMASAIESAGTMAIPRVVGDWVEATASEAIALQAARIAEIESDISGAPTLAPPPEEVRRLASSRPGLPAEENAEATVAEVRPLGAEVGAGANSASQLSSVSVSAPSAPPPIEPPPRFRQAVLAGVLGAAVVATGLFFLLRAHPAPTAAGVAPEPSALPAASELSAAGPPPAPSANPDAAAPAVSAAAPSATPPPTAPARAPATPKRPAGHPKSGVLFTNPG